MRDDDKPAPLHLVRRVVYLNEMDARGEPVTSCVIESDPRTREDREAEAMAAVTAEHRYLDRRTLRVITERPELAITQEGIRVLLNCRKTAAVESLARLMRDGLVLPGGRNKPYQLTESGAAMFAQEGGQ